MKFHIAFLKSFLLISVVCSGQSKIDVSVGFAPLKSYRVINNNNELWNDFIYSLDNVESPLYTSKLGLSINYKPKADSWFLSTGLSHKTIGHKSTVTWWAVSQGTNIKITETSNEEYQYGGVKLGVGRNFRINKSLKLSPLLNGTLDILTKKTSPFRHRYWAYNKRVLGVEIGLNAQYKILKSLFLFVQPLYARSLTSNATLEYPEEFDSGPIELVDFTFKQYNYFVAIEFGITYSLNFKKKDDIWLENIDFPCE